MKSLALTLKIELFLLIILIISFISSFITKIYSYTEIIAGVTLLLMSYNNQKYIKKKYMTPTYAIFGIITIAMAIYKVFNG
ncbi:MAG: hypothetical protein IKJ43_01520 [Bacilli bacterium]|nr:hypothetical protein [Bacilli bacterium]